MQELKKKVLLLIPNLDFGGAQKAFQYMSLELARKYEVIECVFNTEAGVAYRTDNLLVDMQVPAGTNVFSKFWYFLQRCIRLYKIKKQHGIDVTISSLEGADYVNLLSPAHDKRVLLIQGSKSADDPNRTGVIGWMRKKVFIPYLYRWADHIVVVSRDIKFELIQDFGLSGERISIVHNCVDIARVDALKDQPIEPVLADMFGRFPIIITSGRLAEQKNQAPLLDIMVQVKQQSQAKLVVLGDGHLRDPLLSHGRALGLRIYAAWEEMPLHTDYDVYFLGYQENPFKYLSKATLFAFPSDFEGFSLALIEAMACHLAVVSTDCPTGPRELLAPDMPAVTDLSVAEYAAYGVLMPLLNKPDNRPEVGIWAQVLLEMLQNRAMREQYVSRGKERVREFDLSIILRSWPAIID